MADEQQMSTTTSKAEEDFAAMRADPEMLRLLTDHYPAPSSAVQAERNAASEKYSKAQAEAYAAQKQRAAAAKPQFTDHEIASASTKIQSIRLALTDEARRFAKLLHSPGKVGHREATDEWREWNKIAHTKKK